MQKEGEIFSISLFVILIAGFGFYFQESFAQQFVFQIPSEQPLTVVKGIAADSSGNFYASGNYNFIKVSSGGTVIFDVGSGFGSGDGQLDFVHGMALDSSGNIYATDGGNHRIQKFNSAGVFQGWMGRCTAGTNCDTPNEKSNGFSCTDATCVKPTLGGTGNGQFANPQGITIDSSNNIFVVDRNNHRIQIFNSAGVFQSTFGSFGSGDGQISNPQGIEVDSSGNIYVADWANHRVVKFNPAGTFQGWMGRCTSGTNCDVGNSKSNGFSCTAATCSGLGSGASDGQFFSPEDIAVDSSDNIYVVEGVTDRVQMFDSSGTFQGWMGMCTSGTNCDIPNEKSNGFSCTAATCSSSSSGSGPGQFNFPQGIAIDSSNNIYVADTGNHKVQTFNSAGVFQSDFGFGPSNTDGEFEDPYGIATASSNNIYVSQWVPDQIQIFNSSGTFQSKFGTLGSGDDNFNDPYDIAFDNSDNLYVADTNNNRVVKYDSSLVFQGWIGMCTSGTNCDVGNQRNNGFCTDATCSGLSFGSGDGQFDIPRGVAVDDSGNIYVVDSFNDRIQIFNSAGVFQSKFGTFGSGDGQFDFPEDIELDSSGNIYVTDNFNWRVQKFNSAGTFQGWMGMCTSGTDCETINEKSNGFSCTAATCDGAFTSVSGDDGQFGIPNGIAIDNSDNIYVVDELFGQVQIFDPNGTFETKFGEPGWRNEQFSYATRITVDSTGNIYVVDLDSHRIKKFAPECTVPVSGDMIVTRTCTLSSSATVPANVMVQNGVVMTIPSGVMLDIDFTQFNLTVKSGSGVLIKAGGHIT